MFQSLRPSLQRAAAAQQHHSLRNTTAMFARLLSSEASSSSSTVVPPIPSNRRVATPAEIAEAKHLITSPTTARTAHYKQRKLPTYGTDGALPTNDRLSAREPTETPEGFKLYPSKVRYDTGVLPEDMPFLHHRMDTKRKKKFKNPRKRASKMLHVLQQEKQAEMKASKPEVWEVPFRVGDAVELEVLDDGGVDNPNNKALDIIRGVVLGRCRKGLDESIYLKDVLYGEHVERKVKLHSPMVKTLKVLETGFINRGKKKGRRIKRAKLYYLRDRKMEETRVTNVQK